MFTRSATLHKLSDSWSNVSTVTAPGGCVQALWTRNSASLRAWCWAIWKPAGPLSSDTPNRPWEQRGKTENKVNATVAICMEACFCQGIKKVIETFYLTILILYFPIWGYKLVILRKKIIILQFWVYISQFWLYFLQVWVYILQVWVYILQFWVYILQFRLFISQFCFISATN